MKLKPCPFCGANINEQKDKGFRSDIGIAYWVRCQTCRAEGPTAIHGAEEAMEAWNTRVTDPMMEEMVEALEELVDDCIHASGSMDYNYGEFDLIKAKKALSKYKGESDGN